MLIQVRAWPPKSANPKLISIPSGAQGQFSKLTHFKLKNLRGGVQLKTTRKVQHPIAVCHVSSMTSIYNGANCHSSTSNFCHVDLYTRLTTAVKNHVSAFFYLVPFSSEGSAVASFLSLSLSSFLSHSLRVSHGGRGSKP